jgi:integrase
VAARHPAPETGGEQDNVERLQGGGHPALPPHDLRHRRISLWHGQGIPARQIGERVGQLQIAVTLDTYTHVMPLDEISKEAYEAVLV